MDTSKLSLLLSLAGAAALQLHAQPASPEAQNRALELLRQTISQEPSQTPTTPSAPQPVEVTPAPAMTAMPAAAASADQQQQAIMLLRQTMAEQPHAAAPARPTGSSGAKSAKSKSSGSKTATVSPAPGSDSAAPLALPLPMTKQQRLADILEQYRADQLTPAQYQAERAKILAEP